MRLKERDRSRTEDMVYLGDKWVRKKIGYVTHSRYNTHTVNGGTRFT